MSIQQLTNERFLTEIRSLNKTIEEQAAEIAKLKALLERWLQIDMMDGDNAFGTVEVLEELWNDTAEALK